ncbi:ClpP/crotonase-like domain-containing protein [Melampsora americana]|nr:ClpP/crotonase-like domain-containing protein [Melampsora americana]
MASVSARQRLQMIESHVVYPQSHTSNNQVDKLGAADSSSVQTQADGAMRILTLNRPKLLNALTSEMIAFITSCLINWENDKEVALVLIKSNGRAFCAGGDLMDLVKAASSNVTEDRHLAVRYFRQQYRLDNLLSRMSTPVVCFMNGITIGGGLGLTLHIPFRIATENTRITFPEVRHLWGSTRKWEPTFFLPRMDGELGTYLGLTGIDVYGWEAYRSGLASHYISSSFLAALQARLSLVGEGQSLDDINSELNEFSTNTFIENSSLKLYNWIGSKREAIDHCFKQETVEKVITQLEEIMNSKLYDGQGLERWARDTKDRILSRSPSSSKLALLALREGKKLDIDECFEMELKLSATCCIHRDFITGGLHHIKKQGNQVAWYPSTLEDVNLDYLRQSFFSAQPPSSTYLPPFGHISTSIRPYTSYPHAVYSLPSEEVIKYHVIQQPYPVQDKVGQTDSE